MILKRNTIVRFGLASLVFLSPCPALRAASSAQLALTHGWNLVSLPLQPADTNILSVLGPVQGQCQSVWTYSAGRWCGFNPSVPGLDDLKHLQAGRAYWIQMRQDAVLTVTGSVPVNAVNTAAGQDLSPGWNLVGNSSGRAQDVGDASAPAGGQLDLVAVNSSAGWLWHRPANPAASTLASVGPFQGLWAHVNAPSTWIAPNYRGTLINAATGEPVAGATVSLDGIEADLPTDAQGSFLVTGISDDASQLLTVSRSGYTPVAVTVDPAPAPVETSGPEAASQPLSLALVPLAAPLVADVLIPQNHSVWLQPGSCADAGLTVKGYTALQDQSNFLYDIVFVIDTSASTARSTGFDLNGDGREDTVFEAEVEACGRLARMFTDTNHTRFGLVKYSRLHSRNAPPGGISDGPVLPEQSRIVQALTTDPAALQAALQTVAGEGALGGTHTAAGIDLAVEALTDAPPLGGDLPVTPIRHIVLLTDGIPTLPVETGFTQERGDRLATLDAAQRAAASNILIHPVVIDPTNRIDRKLTTMPAVQAITGVPGDVVRINASNIQDLPMLLPQMALTSIPAVTVRDHTALREWNLTVKPNGWFEAALPVSVGTNRWEFVFSSGNALADQTITQTVSFVVYPPHAVIDVVGLSASNAPVRELSHLERPTGGKLKNAARELSLLAVLQQKTPEARVLAGVESFRSLSGVMTLEFVFKGAGFNSDVGYFLFDPVNPPQSAAQVMAGLSEANIFLNSGVVPNGSLNVTGLVNTLEVPPGSAVGLFMIPNGRLADAQAGRGNPPLFTLASLNPGQFDQAVTFYDPEGGQIVCAFEDVNIVNDRADQDFQDLVFTVKPIDPLPQSTQCLAQ